MKRHSVITIVTAGIIVGLAAAAVGKEQIGQADETGDMKAEIKMLRQLIQDLAKRVEVLEKQFAETKTRRGKQVSPPSKTGKRKVSEAILGQSWPEVTGTPPSVGEYRQAPSNSRIFKVIGKDAVIIERPADNRRYVYRRTLTGKPLEYRRRSVEQLLIHVTGIPQAEKLADKAPFVGVLVHQGTHHYASQSLQSYAYCGKRLTKFEIAPDRSDKTYKSVRDIVVQLAKVIYPVRGESWDKLTTAHAQKWLDENILRCKLQQAVHYESSEVPSGYGGKIRMRTSAKDFTYRGITYSLSVTAAFDQGWYAKIQKLREPRLRDVKKSRSKKKQGDAYRFSLGSQAPQKRVPGSKIKLTGTIRSITIGSRLGSRWGRADTSTPIRITVQLDNCSF